MGHRLSKIVTRTGDNGTTGLADGSRIGKDHPRVCAIGDVDELNSSLGLILIHELPEQLRALLIDTQHRLFDIGGELCMPEQEFITDEAIAQLDDALQQLNERLPPLKEFILPGGTAAAAHCHMARTICRRAERSVIALSHRGGDTNAKVLAYLNRLSDLLFVIARTLTQIDNCDEPMWQSTRNPL